LVDSRLAGSRYPVKTIAEIERRLQYGCSKRATVEPTGYPMLRMNNLQANGWDLNDIKYVELTDKELANWKLRPGDIAFNRTNSKELVGKCEVFRETGTWVFASYLMRLQVNESEAIPEFVAAFLNGPTGRSQIDRESRQIIGMSNINAEEIRTLRIPLPNLRKQRELLSALDDLRRQRNAKLADADKLLTSVDKYILEKLGLTLPPHVWPIVYAARLGSVRRRFDADFHSPRFRLLREKIEHSIYKPRRVRELCHFVQTGFAAGGDDQTDNPIDGIPHIRPLNITGFGELHFEGTKFVPRSSIQPYDIIQRGEILFNNTNSTTWVGKTTVFDIDRDCACSNHITRLRLSSDKDNAYFLAATFNALRGLGYFGLLSTNFNNQAGVNTETLRAMSLPWPPPEVQSKIVANIEERRATARKLRSEANSLWTKGIGNFDKALLGLPAVPEAS
jgi:type I restriction enzyme, S subunit